MPSPLSLEGILPINKPHGQTAFTLVKQLRRHLKVQKIGHAGTLDPFATGVMILLIGRNYTRYSDKLLNQEKEYVGRLRLGIETDSYDIDGEILAHSDVVPSLEEVEKAIAYFQGTIQQVPPMFSAKKVGGKKLYELARKGIEIEREAVSVQVSTELVDYAYPYLTIRVVCSKGTYIRSIAQEIGKQLGSGAHLENLIRTRSGCYQLADCFDGMALQESILGDDQMEKLQLKLLRPYLQG